MLHKVPSPQRVELFKKRIKEMYGDDEHYGSLDQSVLDDFAAMAACLTPDVILDNLKQLNAELEKELRSLGMIDEESDTKKIKLKTGKDYVGNYKVLSKMIEDWAHKHGFNQGGQAHVIEKNDVGNEERILLDLPSTIPTVLDFVPPHLFRGLLLAHGYLFKDLGASIRHGEFTHIWAIYTIVEQNKKSPFLKHDPVTLYKLLGTYPYAYLNKSVWNIIFDSVLLTELNSPEMLNDAISGGRIANNAKTKSPMYSSKNVTGVFTASDTKSEMPILSDFVDGRTQKRINQNPGGSIETSAKKAVEKHQSKSGITFNNCILFETKEMKQVKVEFDSVNSECTYKQDDFTKFAVPKISNTDPLIDQLIAVFDIKNWPERDKNKKSYELAEEIMLDLQRLKKKYPTLRHREVTIYFSKMEVRDPYIRALINFCQGLLLKKDESVAFVHNKKH